MKTARLLVACLMPLVAVAQDCEDQTLANGNAWYDSSGPKYNCAWYDANGRCNTDGVKAKYANDGMTASQACCACGGNGAANDGGTCEVDSAWVHPKYGDNCVDYIDGNSMKYNCDSEAVAACCTCQESTSDSGECTPDYSWTHPKYMDTCEDYISGKSKKYNCDLKAKKACCTCAEESSGSCTPKSDWVHPKYNDMCVDYAVGGKSVDYNCDPLAKQFCCTCSGDGAAGSSKDSSCTDLQVDGMPFHDEYGEDFGCEYYGAKANRCAKDGYRFAFKGVTADMACCVCGGGSKGSVCTDKPGEDGAWHDTGGSNYNCEYYAKGNRCAKDGKTYTDANKVFAIEACCVCGGGDVVDTDPGDEVGGLPEPDKGDDIGLTGEWVGSTKFFSKKHLSGDFVLYWNVEKYSQLITYGLLAPEGHTGWVAIGFSNNGGMAGSDALVAWFDDTGKAVISDKWLKNQSPSGVADGNRQLLSQETLMMAGNRMAVVATRPWKPNTGGVEIRAVSAFVNVIYSMGKINTKCSPFCNHDPGERWVAEMAFTAPGGMSLYDLNRGNTGEPCDGVAKVECQEGLYCYHEDSLTGDVWAVDYTKYGTCQNPQDDLDEDEDENYYGEQTVFANDGGFEFKEQMRGGFVLLWSLNKVSAPGSYGPDDTLSMAFISTQDSAEKQGWIGFGFSPNGEMKGSDVVIGWANGDNTHVGDYFLTDQISNQNKEADKQDLVNARVFKKNGQTCITFERKLTPEDSVQVLEGLVHVIHASGPIPDVNDKEFIPYHRFRRASDLTIVPLPAGMEDANAVGAMSLCMGPANIQCQTGLICQEFEAEMLERMSGGRNRTRPARNMSGADGKGFTSASGWGAGGGSSSRGRGSNNSWAQMFSNTSNLIGKGMCITESMQSRWSGFGDTYKIAAVNSVREAGYEFYMKLRWGFDIYWDLMDMDGTVLQKDGDLSSAFSIKLALVASIGPGWLGLGLGTEGAMLGANAIIGWMDNGNATNTRIMEYYLEEKLPWKIMPIEPGSGNDMEVTSFEIITQGHESALVIERPLEPTNGMAPILPGMTTILFAVGNTPLPVDDWFGYHRFRDSAEVAFIPLATGGEADM